MIIPIGGGGLASGIALAIRAAKPNARLVGVQSAAFAPLAGREAGGFTIAEGIAVKHPGELTSSILDEVLDDIVDVTDEEISQAIVLLLERTKLVVEGAGAAPVAALLAGRVGGSGPVVAVLSGGNIDPTLLISVMRHGLSLAGRYLVLRTRLPDRPGELIKLLSLVAEERGNVVSVEHHREGMDMPVTESEVELTLTMRDQEHCADADGGAGGERLPGRAGAMSARRERKVVTVLFADLVGFTSRAESLDPEDVEAISAPLPRASPRGARAHGGTVEKFIGDAVMALFGAPVAHEDDPERAVRAALAIRDWARRGRRARGAGRRSPPARRSSRSTRGPSAGEGMARATSSTRPRGCRRPRPRTASSSTRRRTARREHAIDYREHAPVDAKGKAEPVPVWEAVEARARVGVDVRRAGAPLVGRERELGVLLDALRRVRGRRDDRSS